MDGYGLLPMREVLRALVRGIPAVSPDGERGTTSIWTNRRGPATD